MRPASTNMTRAAPTRCVIACSRVETSGGARSLCSMAAVGVKWRSMTAIVRPGRTFARWLAPAACRMSPDRYRSAPPALTVAEPRALLASARWRRDTTAPAFWEIPVWSRPPVTRPAACAADAMMPFALAQSASLRRALLVVDDHCYPRDALELGLHLGQPVAPQHLGPRGPPRPAAVVLRVLGADDDLPDALRFERPRHRGDVHQPRDVLAAGHGHGRVIEDLERDIDAGCLARPGSERTGTAERAAR